MGILSFSTGNIQVFKNRSTICRRRRPAHPSCEMSSTVRHMMYRSLRPSSSSATPKIGTFSWSTILSSSRRLSATHVQKYTMAWPWSAPPFVKCTVHGAASTCAMEVARYQCALSLVSQAPPGEARCAFKQSLFFYMGRAFQFLDLHIIQHFLMLGR